MSERLLGPYQDSRSTRASFLDTTPDQSEITQPTAKQKYRVIAASGTFVPDKLLPSYTAMCFPMLANATCGRTLTSTNTQCLGHPDLYLTARVDRKAVFMQDSNEAEYMYASTL
jgi:hypothetical protein